jgi:hypothetical protein
MKRKKKDDEEIEEQMNRGEGSVLMGRRRRETTVGRTGKRNEKTITVRRRDIKCGSDKGKQERNYFSPSFFTVHALVMIL